MQRVKFLKAQWKLQLTVDFTDTPQNADVECFNITNTSSIMDFMGDTAAAV